jgi:short-subunit dehydrogenase
MSKHIVITGHTKGIGKAITTQLLKNGFIVTGIARSCLPETKNLIQIKADLTSEFTIKNLAEKLKNTPVDVLILNAGFNNIKPAEAYATKEILDIFNVNLVSHAVLLRACLPKLIHNKGWVFGIGSFSGIEIARWNNYYGAAKAAMHHLLKNIFEQYRKQGLKVTNIIPDIIHSEFYAQQDYEPNTGEPDTFLLPEDISNLIVDYIIKWPNFVPLELLVRPQRFCLNRKKP